MAERADELDADPEVMRYVGGALTPEQAEQALREGLTGAERGRGLGYWAGFVEGGFAGYWNLRPPDRLRGTCRGPEEQASDGC
ncbi:GNAT family protein [Streptomyces acidicola]|uniref:hypothetical protein n=1 Tax=Streptomyces acidicola TaxID=2596892 RepID=UPI003829AE42